MTPSPTLGERCTADGKDAAEVLADLDLKNDERETTAARRAASLELSAVRRKFRRLEGVVGGLTNVMAWDGWPQRSSLMGRFGASLRAARPA